MLTWVLQVLPLFFMAGGYTHALAWRKYHRSPRSWRSFSSERARQFLVPAIVLAGVVCALAVAVATPGGDP